MINTSLNKIQFSALWPDYIQVKDLVSGSKYAFRVYAVSAGGKSSKSTPVVVKVL